MDGLSNNVIIIISVIRVDNAKILGSLPIDDQEMTFDILSCTTTKNRL